MNKFGYKRASTVEDALSLLSQNRDASILAGGTDLIPLMKEEIVSPANLVDISGWQEGRRIEHGQDGLHIGALATLRAIAADRIVQEQYTALADACRLAAAPQLRNMGTIGGNLLQQTRCFYYRGPFDCWLKGGDVCYARGGENEGHSIFLTDPRQSQCVSAHPSDPAAALVALDAHVHYSTADGASEMSIGEFYALPTANRRSFVMLSQGAVITGITIPSTKKDWKSLYRKAMPRATWAFALAGVALAARMEQGNIVEARVALSGVAPILIRAPAVEAALKGKSANNLDTGQLTELLVRDAEPLSQNGYKVTLLGGLFREALAELMRPGK